MTATVAAEIAACQADISRLTGVLKADLSPEWRAKLEQQLDANRRHLERLLCVLAEEPSEFLTFAAENARLQAEARWR